LADPLPVDPYIQDILDAVRRARAVVVTAEPGAGKTTRVSPALLDDGPVILLQPRRAAARAVAQRIAGERGWTIGREVGWQIRFDRRFGADTRLLVATEGVLTGRFGRDPLLSDFRTIVLDEFHERSIHADLALALAKQAWRARDDLRIVVMSATLDSAAVAAFLDGCPVIEVPGRQHRVEISYAPDQAITDAAAGVLGRTPGHVLCFLPGAAEIHRAMLRFKSHPALHGLEVIPLHGSLDAASQDAALRPSRNRRVIVSTNIAETSVTVPGVTAVVDSGLHKVARYDAARGIDSLEVERISRDGADQRAGRAGREAEGLVCRLWDRRDRLRDHREPDIDRIDLSGAVLDVIAWGGDPSRFEWFERPRADVIDGALRLLEQLGAVKSGALTDLGAQIERIPVHPRLARMLLASEGARDIARACALLSERHFSPQIGGRESVGRGAAATTSSDLLSILDDWRNVPAHVKHVAGEIEQIARVVLGGHGRPRHTPLSEAQFRRSVLAGYPDRVGQRREPGSPRVRLTTGAGAVLAPESGVRDAEFLVAVDVRARASVAGAQSVDRVRDRPDAQIHMASAVDRDWLQPTASDIVHELEPDTGIVKAFLVNRYGAVVLGQRAAAVDRDIAANLLAAAWLERGPRDSDQRLLRRLRFAGRAVDITEAVRRAARLARSLDDVHLARGMTAEDTRLLDHDAPETIDIPSGRSIPLEYAEDGSVAASVKLQELFGLAETPRVGPRREPVLLSLLAPNGRPVQLTRDLRSFWDRTYPEVRRELRGRYPRHAWPEDPWRAVPARGPTRRRR
jgi:ATP-dependent helicase HrpB